MQSGDYGPDELGRSLSSTEYVLKGIGLMMVGQWLDKGKVGVCIRLVYG